MSLKERLKIAFVVIILLPILMMTLSAKAIITHMNTSVQNKYGVETSTMQVVTNPMGIINRVTRETYNQIKLTVLREPSKLESMTYLNTLNEGLQEKYSYLLLRKEGQIIYMGREDIPSYVLQSLPEFGNYTTDVDGGLFISDRNPVLIKHQDFYFSDGSEGSIFIITEVNIMMPQLKNSVFQAIICIVVIVALTAVILIVWLYRTIIRPLNTLKKATQEMKEGNLNYSITGDPKDEIGQLCRDFDEMREHMKELIEERLEYEQDSRELISNISHDLKTPLTAIKGYSEGIIDGIADTPDKMEKYIKTIYTKANDMSVLVDELSVFSKIDSNTVPYEFAVLNVNDYFMDCIDELSLELEVKNMELLVENKLQKDVCIYADPEQLKRVINNIVSNSVKYMDKEKGMLRVRAKNVGKRVQFDLEDNGAGIPKKDIPYVFDRFYRADASRNSRTGGTGLGLAIAKKIIEDHRGRIWAGSTLGEGTTISFSLPIYKGAEEKTEQTALRDKERRLLHLRVPKLHGNSEK